MRQKQRKHHFKKCETGYHKHACIELAEWVNGKVNEEPFTVDGVFMFTPDVITTDNNIVTGIFEVVKSHPVDGKKLGKIQYWCYRNFTELTVYEVDADYILKQTERPEVIDYLNVFTINPREY
jgi:hypothetical protein